jgi:NAD+ synthetase
MKQREILDDIAPDFARDNQTREDYIEQKKNAVVGFVKRYVPESGMDGVVLGISGGVDSFLTGALLACALREINKKLRLILLPNGRQPDYRDAVDCAQAICGLYPETEWDTVSIKGGYRAAVRDLEGKKGFLADKYTLGNLQPRIRMMYQYALAANMLVAGTDHAAEAVTGFYTKYGDGGSDINPIQELVKDDIYEMAASLGAPKNIMEKSPAAGIGITADDETELGMKYSDICAYLKGGRIDPGVRGRLEAAYGRSRHKRSMPASPRDDYSPDNAFTFLVVDFIHAFIDGELPCLNARAALEKSVSMINAYPRGRVLYVRDYHPQNHCSFKENGGIWDSHAVAGTNSSRFPELFYSGIKKTVNTPLERYNVFNKGMDAGREQYSGMEAVNECYGALADNLSQKVVVLGAATEYCILGTVRGLLAAGRDVIVPEGCLGYVDEQGHRSALRQMAEEGARIV